MIVFLGRSTILLASINACMTLRDLIGLFRTEIADSAQPNINQWSPDSFPRERVGSGHETSFLQFLFLVSQATPFGVKGRVWSHCS